MSIAWHRPQYVYPSAIEREHGLVVMLAFLPFALVESFAGLMRAKHAKSRAVEDVLRSLGRRLDKRFVAIWQSIHSLLKIIYSLRKKE